MTTEKPFHKRLQEAREQRGISVRQAAKYGNVSEALWREFEEGARLPETLTIKKVFGSHHRIINEIPDAPTAVPPAPPPLVGADAVPPVPPAPRLCDALKAARAASGTSRADLAQILGVSYGAVEQWENGTTTPINGHMIELVKLFPQLAPIAPEGKQMQKPGGAPRAQAAPAPAAQTEDTTEAMRRIVDLARVLRGGDARVVLSVDAAGCSALLLGVDQETERSGPDGAALIRALLDELRAEARAQLEEAQKRTAALERLAR